VFYRLLQTYLELGESVEGLNGSEASCCHLFAGTGQGSTTVMVVDIGSVRDVHKKRGFISVAGGGVQALTQVDGRLKGPVALNTIKVVRPRGGAENDSFGYSATYQLITGRGMGVYHIWEVVLESKPSGNSRQSSPMHPAAGAGGGNSSSSGGLLFTQRWTHLYQGNVGGPTMNFAHFVAVHTVLPQQQQKRHNFYAIAGVDALQHEGHHPSDDTTNNGVAVELLFGEQSKDLRHVSLMRKLSPVPGSADGSDSVDGFATAAGAGDTAAATQLVPSNSVKHAKLKNSMDTFVASADGRVLFGGKYELIVSVYGQEDITGSSSTPGIEEEDVAEGAVGAGAEEIGNAAQSAASAPFSVIRRVSFSLTDFVSDAIGTEGLGLKSSVAGGAGAGTGTGNSSSSGGGAGVGGGGGGGGGKRASRHLREISKIWCTDDGAYALILCTDNAVLLFR
jgi:hypothetical protein